MSDMRLIVAGVSGRMGRTLVHAIAATDGVTLAGAVEAAGSAVIGRDAGELAGLGKNGVVVETDVAPLLDRADGLIDFTVPELVAERAAQARDIGIDGLVASAAEAKRLRPIIGPRMVLATPGIRPPGAEAGDQKRIMTPAAAIKAGADYLIVGRPVIAATDPKAAADAMVAEIARARGDEAA